MCFLFLFFTFFSPFFFLLLFNYFLHLRFSSFFFSSYTMT